VVGFVHVGGTLDAGCGQRSVRRREGVCERLLLDPPVWRLVLWVHPPRLVCPSASMAWARRLVRAAIDYFSSPATHLAELQLAFGLSEAHVQTAWVQLFERHPDAEVIHHDTTASVCEALNQLRVAFNRVARSVRLEMFYFTSSAGSGKSRFCGQLAEFVLRVQRGDEAAAFALDSCGRSALGASSSAAGSLSSWVKRLCVVGVNFNSKAWSLNGTDRELFKYGKFVPLYLRILFFVMGDLQASTSASTWTRIGKRCLWLFENRYISEETLCDKVECLLEGLAGEGPLRRPLIILIDELQKVSEFFDVNRVSVGDRYRSELCRLAEVVDGSAVFSSIDADLMVREKTSGSHRPVLELLALPRVPVHAIFKEVLRVNAERGIYLNFDGTLASSTLGPSPMTAASGALAHRSVAALSCLVGDDVRLATYLALELMELSLSSGSLWAHIQVAADRTSFSVGNLFSRPYGAVVLAHAIMGYRVVAEKDVLDIHGGSLGVTWDEVRLRGHVLAVGGETFVPHVPLHPLWKLVSHSTTQRNTLFRSIGVLLSWSPARPSWCGWEVFFLASLMVLSNARALVDGVGELCSVADLFPSSTHVGRSPIVLDNVIESVQPRLNLCTSNLVTLVQRFVSTDDSLLDRVWKLNNNAAAIDAVVFYKTVDGVLAMVCIQNKFSASDASTLMSWTDSSNYVAAMQRVCRDTAGAEWATLRPRVAFVVAARRMRRPEYGTARAQQPRQCMDSAVVLCWEDLEQHLGSFLYGLVDHADTLFGAEVAENCAVP